MGGAVSLRSEYGVGSTFYFVLPMQEIESDLGEMNMEVLSGANVLVVDDLSANIARVTKLLDRHNIDHRESTEPHTAMTMYALNRKYRFTIGLIDMVMPVMDGNQFAEMISRSDNPFPLIALSSLDEGVNDIGSHFADHLRKPFTDDQLLRTMIRVIERHERNAKMQSSSSENSLDDLSSESPGRKKSGMRKTSFPSNNAETVYNNLVRGRGLALSRRERSYYEPAENFGINILVVDDVRDNVNVLVGFLHKLGYQNITVAGNGQEAVEAVINNLGSPLNTRRKSARSKFNVVLMDILMPVMDGITAAQKISDLFTDSTARPTIIAVTAANVESTIAEGIRTHMDGVITKPIVEIDRLGKALKDIR
jgi:CheY-like chemotaxis protein